MVSTTHKNRLPLLQGLLLAVVLLGVTVLLAYGLLDERSALIGLQKDRLRGQVEWVVGQYAQDNDLLELRVRLRLLAQDPVVAKLAVSDPDGFALFDFANPARLSLVEAREAVDVSLEGKGTLRVDLAVCHPFLPRGALAVFPALLLLPLALGGYAFLQWSGRQIHREFSALWMHPGHKASLPPIPQLSALAGRLITWRREIEANLQEVRQHEQALRTRAERAGIELRDSQAAELMARQQARSLRAVFQQSSSAMGFLAPDGRILEINATGQDLMQRTIQELRGQRIWAIQALGDPETVESMVNRVRQGETVRHQVEIQHPTRGTLMVAYAMTPIRSDDFALEMIILEGHNITDRVRAEQALHETVSQFQQSQKMEAIGRLAGGIAHDFNNLLTSILGFTNMAKDSVQDNPTAVGDLQEVVQAATRAQNLTQKLLALSRKDAPGSKQIDLSRLLTDLEKLIRVTLHEDIDFVLDLDKRNPCLILADPTSLEQVIVNMAVNARDAMPRSGRLYIETRREHLTKAYCRKFEVPPGDYVLLRIKDTGCGMPPEIMAHIFEPFFTTKESGQGTGLGLSTVYAIVQQYNGFIDLTSKPGEGTEFRIYFPCCGQPPGTQPPEPTTGDPEPENLPRGTETILLVEDEEGVRKLAGRIIEKLGYRLLTAVDGEDGCRVAREYKGKIDLIVTDVVMPNLSGPEMIDQIQVSVGFIPHIYVSGFTQDKLKQHGADGSEELLIRKPYSREVLAQRIRQTLDQHKSVGA